jgi:predicted S18 family serine protease
MRDYAVDDYGLVLDEETIKTIASKLFDDYDANEDVAALAYELYDRDVCEYISNFTGEAQDLDENGFYYGENSTAYYSDVIAYVQAIHYPTLFKKAYNNMDEMIEEFKNQVGEYLPEDFDYRSRIRHICGTYFG